MSICALEDRTSAQIARPQAAPHPSCIGTGSTPGKKPRDRHGCARSREPLCVETHESTAVVLVDTSGVIRYWSSGATSLFGVSDPVGDTLDVIVPSEFRDRHWAGFQRAMKTGESPISGGRLNIPV